MIESNKEICVIGNLYNPISLKTQPELIENTINICVYCEKFRKCKFKVKHRKDPEFEKWFEKEFADIFPEIRKLSLNPLNMSVIISFKYMLNSGMKEITAHFTDVFRKWVSEQITVFKQ